MDNLTEEQLADAVAKTVAYDFKRDDSLLCVVPSDLRKMQQVIRQLWAERQANRAVMEQAREALKNVKLCAKAIRIAWVNRLVIKAIAALDAALGSQKCERSQSELPKQTDVLGRV